MFILAANSLQILLITYLLMNVKIRECMNDETIM